MNKIVFSASTATLRAKSLMRLPLISLAAVLLPMAAQAAPTISIIERDTTTTINPGGTADFTSASYTYANDILFNTVAGTEASTLTIQPSAMGINFVGLGSTVVTPTTLPDGTASTNVNAVSPGGAGQGYFFGYQGADTGFLSSGTSGGLYDLTFSGGGVNALDVGGTFDSTVKILGDFSSAASHTAATYGAGYSVVQNFVYSGGYTYFSVSTNNFQSVQPSISFSLLGGAVAAVPEPAAWTMMILGFGWLGAALRRTRQSNVVTG